jgi:hypothetical protein
LAELRVETRAEGEAPGFAGPTADLVYFLSFAVAERFGSTHDLSGVARVLRSRATDQSRGDQLRPLLTFAEDTPEDPEERQDMEKIWQPARPVAVAASWTAEEIRRSERLRDLAAAFPDLVPRLDDLAEIAAWSADRSAEIRLLFRL